MLKRISIIARKDSLSEAEFLRSWHGQHVELVRQVPGICGYVQNAVVSGNLDNQPTIDGIAEMWFESEDTLNKALGSVEWQSVVADGRTFLARSQNFIVNEVIAIPPAQ